MINVAQLLHRVSAHGCRVELTEGGPVLFPSKGVRVPTPLLAALRDNRDAVIAYLSECRLCRRDVRNAEDRERLKGINPFCGVLGCPLRERT